MQADRLDSTVASGASAAKVSKNIRSSSDMIDCTTTAMDQAFEVVSVLHVLSMGLDHLSDTTGITPIALRRIESMNEVLIAATKRLDNALGITGAALVSAKWE